MMKRLIKRDHTLMSYLLWYDYAVVCRMPLQTDGSTFIHEAAGS